MNVARIAQIFNLEEGLMIPKDVVYAAALLHPAPFLNHNPLVFPAVFPITRFLHFTAVAVPRQLVRTVEA